ncbi:MAG: hypothetical protein H6574_02150 [Lewinellaceae bacterium]|nr:hypothetical protein [Saprospiraceae bacterium]MCB9315075.1 hypothetical protein [Lewinellaceae bacterium]MCB9329862.1 hypothetical protein [Lewinellaceae bacterium]
MKKLPVVILILVISSGITAQTMPPEIKKITDKYACNSCHVLNKRVVGPSWKDLSQKKYSAKKMLKLIREPQPGNWPDYPPMAPIQTISSAEVKLVADWLNGLN